MGYLKEDGSLDIERINDLPSEEYIKEISSLSQKQLREYISRCPISESNGIAQPIHVDYTMEEDVERNGLVNAKEFLQSKIKEYKHKK